MWIVNILWTRMLTKSAENSNWDFHLPFLMFANRASPRISTFYLLYGRDPCLSTEDFQKNMPNYAVDVDDYKSALRTYLESRQAQIKQDTYDKTSK